MPEQETDQGREWCGQCRRYGDHTTNRCPVGDDVYCLTHNAWMKRGATKCNPLTYRTETGTGGVCRAAS